MDQYSIIELADDVNDWCAEHGVEPLNNQAGKLITVRNIRYYQSLGLVDRPEGADGRGFRAKHRLQLIGIRLLQARGLPLERIHALLYGRTEKELREIERRGARELSPAQKGFARRGGGQWQVVALDEDHLLLTRSGRQLTAAQRTKMIDILNIASVRQQQKLERRDK